MKFRFEILLLLIGATSCGTGDFRMNPSAGTLSELSDSTPTNAKDFFKEKLFPIMTAPTGSKHCTGCHSRGASQDPSTKPFQIDASDKDFSWNYAKVRRLSPVVETAFSVAGGSTLQKLIVDDNHNSVNWTASEKALVNQWVSLTTEE